MNLKFVCKECNSFLNYHNNYYKLSLISESIIYCVNCRKYVKAKLIDIDEGCK